MKIKYEWRYFITDIVAIPICRNRIKSDAYRQATGDGWGTVYTTNESNELICDEDCSAQLINKYGQYIGIYPYEELQPKTWYKQAECAVIITSDSCGYMFYEEEKGLVKIFVTYDENGYIDTYRLGDWTEKTQYDGEIEINFEDLPEIDPYNAH